MSVMQKLTKKQKKAVAFRGRKLGHSKGKHRTREDGDDEYDNVVPISENQDLAEIQGDDVEDEAGDARISGGMAEQVAKKGKERNGKQKEKKQPGVVVESKKRKRETGSEGVVDAKDSADKETPSQKKRKRPTESTEDGKDVDESKEPVKKQRFVLFLGNLKYTTTADSIKAHFSGCDPPPTIRLLTPKKSPNSSSTTSKSKGCAFLEFANHSTLQEGLKLHHSLLDGRTINVELTAGGGGKGENRLMKLKERNKQLEEQRRKRLAKKSASREGDAEPETQPQGPQRYSATSGLEDAPKKKNTWAVGDVVEEGTHRGGKKHVRGKKSRTTKVKDFRTGVNSIPVG